jgi:protein-tyrosine phosphatase
MRKIKTSDSDPIIVAFVETSGFSFPGRIGLTFAPGKKQPDGLTASWDRDLELDLARLSAEYGTEILVTLIEAHEFDKLGIPDLRARTSHHKIESIWFPIPDTRVPQSMQEFSTLIEKLAAHLNAGKTVVIHCMGGRGRTGLVAAACLLATTELTVPQAIMAVRQARSGAIENTDQENFVRDFANHLRASNTN